MNQRAGKRRRVLGGATTLLLVLAAALLHGQPKPPGGGRPPLNGSYELSVHGYYEGTGNAAVGAKNVNVNLHVVSEIGESEHFVFPNLDLVNGRFHGRRTFKGVEMRIQGRVEPADGTVLTKPRLSCTFSTLDGKGGQAIGQRRGS